MWVGAKVQVLTRVGRRILRRGAIIVHPDRFTKVSQRDRPYRSDPRDLSDRCSDPRRASSHISRRCGSRGRSIVAQTAGAAKLAIPRTECWSSSRGRRCVVDPMKADGIQRDPAPFADVATARWGHDVSPRAGRLRKNHNSTRSIDIGFRSSARIDTHGPEAREGQRVAALEIFRWRRCPRCMSVAAYSRRSRLYRPPPPRRPLHRLCVINNAVRTCTTSDSSMMG